MAFSSCANVQRASKEFTEKVKGGVFQKDYLTNHGKEFLGSGEELARFSFLQFIGSASYVMMKMRSKGVQKGDYYGC